MVDPYTYRIDTSDFDGAWHNEVTAETRATINDREPTDVARAILEDWIVDHPANLGGGERVAVFGEDPTGYPPDEYANIRVFVFRGRAETHESEPASAAYLVDLPDE